MLSWFRNRSIFIKLTLTIVVAAFFVSIIIVSFIRHLTNQPRHKFNQFINGTIEYIIKDLGNPPNLKQAKQIGARLGIEIRYEGVLEQWSTSKLIPSSNDIVIHNDRSSDRIRFGHATNRFFLLYSKGEDQFVLMYDFPFHDVDRTKWLVRLAIPILIIFIFTYILLRRIFSPIKALSQGVLKVGDGDYDLKLNVKSKDELGGLITAFNQMTIKIKENIKSKEQLILDVSHELRSPLTRIKVALEMLKKSGGKTSIHDDIVEMEIMLTELLESARLNNHHGSLNLESAEFCQFLSDFIKKSNFQLSQVQYTPAAMPIWVQIDQERIKIVFKNLLENAIKFSAGSDAPVLLKLYTGNQNAIIEIIDQGDGIPEDELPKLFEPFYRVDRSRSKKTGGYGLGLSICRTIIQSHQGEIKINSNMGSGTTILLELPLHPIDK